MNGRMFEAETNLDIRDDTFFNFIEYRQLREMRGYFS